jgi:DNA-binding MarR family transcriptional regulator
VLGKVTRGDVNAHGSGDYEDVRSYSSDLLKGAIFQELRDEISELRLEVLLLREEVIKNKQCIVALDRKKKSHGKEIKGRVDSMLLLISDYGGSLTSSSVKAYMGLSKDELYRTLKCAKDKGLIEVLPDPHDRRGYVLNINLDASKNLQNLIVGSEEYHSL